MINALISTKKIKHEDIINNLVKELYKFYCSYQTGLNVYINNNSIGVNIENNQYIKSLFKEYNICQFIPRKDALIFSNGTDQIVPKNIREIYEDFNCDIQSWINFKDKDYNIDLMAKKVTVYGFFTTLIISILTISFAFYQHFDSKDKDKKIKELELIIKAKESKILEMKSIISVQSKELKIVNQQDTKKIPPK